MEGPGGPFQHCIFIILGKHLRSFLALSMHFTKRHQLSNKLFIKSTSIDYIDNPTKSASLGVAKGSLLAGSSLLYLANSFPFAKIT